MTIYLFTSISLGISKGTEAKWASSAEVAINECLKTPSIDISKLDASQSPKLTIVEQARMWIYSFKVFLRT
jgi:hypothetical protein